MGWVRVIDRVMATGQEALCRLKHCSSGAIETARLVRVAEGDCNWRTAGDRCEVSYDWDVIEWFDDTSQLGGDWSPTTGIKHDS